MVKNQNWQRRVETAEARRQEQRSRKARKSDRESHRAMASALMFYLGTSSAISSVGGDDDGRCDDDSLHVWLDSPPQSSGSVGNKLAGTSGNFDSDEHGIGCGHNKSKKEQSRNKQQQQGSPKSKKAHPRQKLKKRHEEQHHTDGTDDDILLCGNHFFFDKCADAGRSNGKGNRKRGSNKATACRLHHSQEATLASILKNARDANADIAESADVASQSSTATETDTTPSSTDRSINMLWYLSTSTDKKDEVGTIQPNEALQACLSRNNVGSASIVYIVWRQSLLYDRNRGGVLEETNRSELADDTVGDENDERRRRHRRSRGESLGSSVDLGNVNNSSRRGYGRSRGESLGSSMDLGNGSDIRRRRHGRSRGESMGSSVDLGNGKDARRKYGRSRGESMAESVELGDCIDEGDDILLHLPGSVLETILTYLPDLYTGNLPLLCKSWCSEIGKSSPNLWRQLLLRRGFPLPASIDPPNEEVSADTAVQQSPREVYRDAFIGHYEACRDLEAISELFLRLQHRQSQQRESFVFSDACMLNYSSNPGLPRDSSGAAVATKIWRDGKVIIAYEDDCTVRLFETVSTGGSLACRQTVCVIISPEPKSKRGRWFLGGMDLDDNYVCCVCRPEMAVETEMEVVLSPYMHIVKREDILCASGGGKSANRPIELDEDDILSVNLREELINYLSVGIYSSDTEDDRDADLIDYIENEDHSYLRVRVSSDIVACGRGRFLMKAEFSLVDVELGALTGEEALAYRIFLYSVSDRRFVWSANIGIDALFHLVPTPRMFGMYLLSSSMSTIESSQSPFSLPFIAIMTDPFTSRLTYVENLKGHVELLQNDVGQMALNQEISGWDGFFEQSPQQGQNSSFPSRPAAFTSSEVVVAHNIYTGSRESSRSRAVLTFSSIEMGSSTNSTNPPPASALTLQGDCVVYDIQALRSDHLILLCQTSAYETGGRNRQEMDDNVEDGDDENDIAGDWFGVANENGHAATPTTTGEDALFVVLLHVPSRTEIGRYRLMDLHISRGMWVPTFRIAAAENTIALEAKGEGLIMSGRGVREVLHSKKLNIKSPGSDQKNSKKNAKKKNAKKDGFARGMARYI